MKIVLPVRLPLLRPADRVFARQALRFDGVAKSGSLESLLGNVERVCRVHGWVTSA